MFDVGGLCYGTVSDWIVYVFFYFHTKGFNFFSPLTLPTVTPLDDHSLNGAFFHSTFLLGMATTFQGRIT